jgi:hypothetical protein
MSLEGPPLRVPAQTSPPGRISAPTTTKAIATTVMARMCQTRTWLQRGLLPRCSFSGR